MPGGNFFTEGNARWYFLLGTVVVVGLVGVATELPAINSLRQDLLNHSSGAISSGTMAKSNSIRAAMRGNMDRTGDDMHKVEGARPMVKDGSSWDPLSLDSSSPDTSVESKCVHNCDSNGYSAREAGPAAAKACVDVCLSEKGGMAKTNLATVAEVKRGRHMPATPSGLVREGPSLTAFLQREGVRASTLPRGDGKRLSRAQQLDTEMIERAASGRATMKKMWQDGMQGMAKYEAARLDNAHNLAAAMSKALTDNRATIEADARILRDATAYSSAVGEGSGVLPVNLAEAKRQLAKARGREQVLEKADEVAIVMEREEKRARVGGLAHAQDMLAAPTWARHEGAGMVRGWGREVEAADSMPHSAASAVRLAAMSEGKLKRMEEKLYAATKDGEERLAEDVKRQHDARVASAELLQTRMGRDASEEGRKARLALAKEAYLSRVRAIDPAAKEGKATTQRLEDIRADAQQETASARELTLAGGAAMSMLRTLGVDPGRVEQAGVLRKRIESAEAEGRDVEAEPEGGAVAAVAAAPEEHHVGDFLVGGSSEHAAGSRAGEMGGQKAVEDASKGWFSMGSIF